MTLLHPHHHSRVVWVRIIYDYGFSSLGWCLDEGELWAKTKWVEKGEHRSRIFSRPSIIIPSIRSVAVNWVEIPHLSEINLKFTSNPRHLLGCRATNYTFSLISLSCAYSSSSVEVKLARYYEPSRGIIPMKINYALKKWFSLPFHRSIDIDIK